MKLIAVDMDGTFLNDNNEYDEIRFKHIYDKMRLDNIRFVVASSNHPSYLKNFSLSTVTLFILVLMVHFLSLMMIRDIS